MKPSNQQRLFLSACLVCCLCPESLGGPNWLDQAGQRLHELQEQAQQKAQEVRQDVQQRVDRGRQEFQTRQQQLTEQARSSFQGFSNDQRNAISEGVNRIYSQYGEAQANRLVSSVQQFGPKGGELVTQCFERYGNNPEITQRILNNVTYRSNEVREKILAAYQSQSVEIGDRVADCYSRYGNVPDFAEKLSGLYLQRKDEFAAQISRLALNQRLEGAKSIAAYYLQNQNEKLANKLCELQQKYDERYRNDLSKITSRVVAQIRDPQNQDRAIECAIKAIELYNDRKEFSTTAIKTVLTTVTVTTRSGERITAEQLIQREILRQCPQLAGTTIAEDPVRCLVYGVLYQDSDFLFTEMKVIPGPNGALSANEALCGTLQTDPAQTIDTLERVEAWSTIVDENATVEESTEAVAVLVGQARSRS